ncbi:MAG: hypothetical protein ABID79_02315 [Elusimicrobiota bacterium]
MLNIVKSTLSGKKFLLVLLVVSMTTSVFANFSNISVRMFGINPDLVGIVADEYSDPLSINPSDLLSVRGYRVFTNLSNLYGNAIGNDRALGGFLTGGLQGSNQFLLGAFGNPFSGTLADAQFGLLFNTGSNLYTNINTLNNEGETILNATTQEDSNNDGDFADAGDWTQIENKRVKREIMTFGADYNFLASYKLMDSLKLGFGISSDDADINGTSSSEESITGNHYQQITTVATPNEVLTHNYSLTAKEENINSTTKIEIGGRYDIDERFNIGTRIGIIPTSQEKRRDSIAKLNIDLSQEAANVYDPLTAEVIAVDGDLQRLPDSLPDDFGVLGNSPVTNGFDWTGGDDWGTFNTSGWSGITGNEVGSSKADGTGIGTNVDSYYDLTDSVKLVGRINFQTTPQDLTASLSQTYSEVYYTSASVVGGKRLVTTNDSRIYTVIGEIEDNTIGITIGGKAKLENDIILGFGAICITSKSNTNGCYTMARNGIMEKQASFRGGHKVTHKSADLL